MERLTSKVVTVAGRRLSPGDAIGAYTFRSLVGSGGMAHVLLATDPEGRQVAIKVLKSTREETVLQRFRREFRALEKLQHPNVIRVYTHGRLFGHPYIAMEYVEGSDLHQEIRGYSTLTRSERWSRVESNLSDLGKALYYIHRRGLVHRDLKPSNVLIDGEGRCRITDFGIVKDLDPSSDPFVSMALVGTWAYASPEQITGQPIDHRSDLYSLGVILFAMLTGRRAFTAKGMAGYLALHRDHMPMFPRAIDPEIPPHLEDICLRLLAKAPHDRFQSGLEILDRLESTTGSSRILELEEPAWSPPLVGREEELRQIDACVSGLTNGRGGVLLIEGVEGSGCTRLFKTAIEWSSRIGIPIHQFDVSASRGVEPLLDVAAVLSRELGTHVPPELLRAQGAFVGSGRKLVGDVRYQLYDAIRRALRLLLREGPLVVAVDDFHLAPAPLVGLLSFLVRTLVVRDRQSLLLLLTLEPDRAGRTVAGIRDGRELGLSPVRLELSPLTSDDVRQLVQSRLGTGVDPTELAARLHRETGGNPFFINEYLRSSPDTRSGPDTDEDALTTDIFARPVPTRIREVVDARLASLTVGERALIEVLSAGGSEIDLDILISVLSDQDEDELLDRIDALIDVGLLVERRVGLQTLIGFTAPKMGAVLVETLEPARRQDLHQRFGQALEERHAGNPLASEAIATHYQGAGDAGSAYLHLVAAAYGMWERSLMGEAARLAHRAREIAARAEGTLSSRERKLARMKLGIVSDALGGFDPPPDTERILGPGGSSAE